MPREIVVSGLLMPTLLPIFIFCIFAQWGIDALLSRLGLYDFVWHPALLRLALFLSLFGLLGLMVYL